MVQYVITGLASGGIYALLGIGMVLTFRCTNVLNFAQGEMSMLMTFVSLTALTSFGFNLPASLALTVLVSVLFGFAIYMGLIGPIRLRNLEQLAIATLALKLSITGLAALIWGPAAVEFPQVFFPESYHVGGLTIIAGHIWAIALGVLSAVFISLYLRYTDFGMSMRAASENGQIAQLLGIDIRRVGCVAWILASILGAATGILLSSTTLVSPYMMGLMIIKVFAAVLLGGLTSIAGAVVGGFLLGVVESAVAYFFDPLFQDSTALLVLLLILMIKPEGLLGTKLAWRS